MADDLHTEIERLEVERARLETLLADLEAEVLDLRRELLEFKQVYDRVVQSVATRLDAVRAAIADLEQRRAAEVLGDYNPLPSAWTPPPGYVPVEEQFRRTWRVTPDEAEAPTIVARARQTTASLDDREICLKRLYRQLARRYHPDLATDPDERERRTPIMARINEAYAARNLDALQTLADQPEQAAVEAPLAALRLHDLRQINAQLARRLAQLERERADLLNSDLMALKIDDRLARRQGRDILREMAARMEQEYAACLLRLDQLRRR